MWQTFVTLRAAAIQLFGRSTFEEELPPAQGPSLPVYTRSSSLCSSAGWAQDVRDFEWYMSEQYPTSHASALNRGITPNTKVKAQISACLASYLSLLIANGMKN